MIQFCRKPDLSLDDGWATEWSNQEGQAVLLPGVPAPVRLGPGERDLAIPGADGADERPFGCCLATA
jgi:hypothetical protein